MSTVQAEQEPKASVEAGGIPSGSWSVDRLHSHIGFSVKHAVIAKFKGAFEDYDATLTDASGTPTLRGEARVASVDVDDEQLNGHLQSPDFFDSERHPAIVFEASDLRADGEKLVAFGKLTIKGVTKEVEARGEIHGPSTYLDEKQRIGISLETVVDRTEYGLEWNAPLPSGGVAVQNEVTLSVELQLVADDTEEA
jgi:polyisoprenoid-binding protein YceI